MILDACMWSRHLSYYPNIWLTKTFFYVYMYVHIMYYVMSLTTIKTRYLAHCCYFVIVCTVQGRYGAVKCNIILPTAFSAVITRSLFSNSSQKTPHSSRYGGGALLWVRFVMYILPQSLKYLKTNLCKCRHMRICVSEAPEQILCPNTPSRIVYCIFDNWSLSE